MDKRTETLLRGDIKTDLLGIKCLWELRLFMVPCDPSLRTTGLVMHAASLNPSLLVFHTVIMSSEGVERVSAPVNHCIEVRTVFFWLPIKILLSPI